MYIDWQYFYICINFCENICRGLNREDKLKSFFSAHHKIMLTSNICIKFHENTFDSFNVKEVTRFPYKSGYNCQLKITTGHNSMRNAGGDLVLILCSDTV